MEKHKEKTHETEISTIEAQGIKNSKEKYRCKITVLRTAFNEDLYRQYPYGGAHACGRLKEGQVFITNSRWDPPEGLCTYAWGDLRSSIQSIHGGHDVPMIACCTDGLRPVTFKLERIEGKQD